MVVRANAAVMAGAGAMLAFGRLPRLAGAVLAITMVPTTYAGHPFWQEKDPDIRRQQRNPLPQEPGPARRRDARRGRHRGPAGLGLARPAGREGRTA
jgi:hypothetical protein